MKKIIIETEWDQILGDFLITKKFIALTNFLKKEYSTKIIYPKSTEIFKAFQLTPFSKVKIIILGQDPYHQKNQAHGLSFSVPDNITPPPSLRNIYQEIESDLKIKKDFSHGNLESWAKQGVFLLNTILTVVDNQATSHRKKGWEEFTDQVIKTLSDQKENLVFILWGNCARSKKFLINSKKHLILEAPHPSPLSAYSGFFGCKHFSQSNRYLEKYHETKINW